MQYCSSQIFFVLTELDDECNIMVTLPGGNTLFVQPPDNYPTQQNFAVITGNGDSLDRKAATLWDLLVTFLPPAARSLPADTPLQSSTTPAAPVPTHSAPMPLVRTVSTESQASTDDDEHEESDGGGAFGHDDEENADDLRELVEQVERLTPKWMSAYRGCEGSFGTREQGQNS